MALTSPSPRRNNPPTSQGGTPLGTAAPTGLIDARYNAMMVTVLWLLAWLVNNIGVTMLNKYAFSIAGFPYPLVTSAFHMVCNWLGTAVYFWVTGMEKKTIKRQHWRTLIAFSFVFSLNIGVGNISQKMVPVSFNQVMRSLVPAIVMVIGINMFSKKFSRARKLAVVPVVIGVALACYGEMADSVFGFGVTVLCIMFAAFKVVLSGEMLTGEMKVLLIAGSSLYLGEDTKSWVNIVGFIVVALASTRYSMLSVAERNREIKGDPSVETGTGPLLPK